MHSGHSGKMDAHATRMPHQNRHAALYHRRADLRPVVRLPIRRSGIQCATLVHALQLRPEGLLAGLHFRVVAVVAPPGAQIPLDCVTAIVGQQDDERCEQGLRHGAHDEDGHGDAPKQSIRLGAAAAVVAAARATAAVPGDVVVENVPAGGDCFGIGIGFSGMNELRIYISSQLSLQTQTISDAVMGLAYSSSKWNLPIFNTILPLASVSFLL